MTPRTPAEEEVANIECHIRMLLPEDYLARIGATVDAPNHKRELRHRCMRIFADLAERLTASPAAPEGETPRDADICACGHWRDMHNMLGECCQYIDRAGQPTNDDSFRFCSCPSFRLHRTALAASPAPAPTTTEEK